MRYLHTMIRVHDLTESLDFFCNKLGLVESHRYESEQGRFTLVYLYAPLDADQALKMQAP
ncbi:MAG: VOC family protein, partial [Methylococcaceae bacterium]|nr:VOC family protein [Methylococcaceae bacterium]